VTVINKARCILRHSQRIYRSYFHTLLFSTAVRHELSLCEAQHSYAGFRSMKLSVHACAQVKDQTVVGMLQKNTAARRRRHTTAKETVFHKLWR
jgi:hypothetical protein